MGNIKFSICIPNYNYGQYLGETIQSVLDQTYQNFEIIIADNASTDKSVEVVKSFHDERIQLIQNKYNIGFSGNVDKAASGANGDFIILQLSDDILKPHALEDFANLINLYSNGEEDVMICGRIEMSLNGNVIRLVGPKNWDKDAIKKLEKEGKNNIVSESPLTEICRGVDVFKSLMTTTFSVPGPVQATCFSKSLYDKVGGYSSPTMKIPDASFGQKICFMNPKVIYYSKTLATMRVHNTSISAEIGKIQNIVLLVDKYLLSLEYTDKQLSSVGLSRKVLQTAFIKMWCNKTPMHYLFTGKIKKFYFYFIFGFSSYPQIMLSRSLTYIIILSSLFSPIFWITGIIYRRFVKN